jgi:hypothetical protein
VSQGAQATGEVPDTEDAATAEQAVAHKTAESSTCDKCEDTLAPSPTQAVTASGKDHDGRHPCATAPVGRAHDAAGGGSPPPSGTDASPPVLAFVATPAPTDGAPAPSPPPMPAPLPPPVPPAPASSCTTGAAGSYAGSGGQHGGSVLDLVVLGKGIPAPSLSAPDLPHGSDVDAVTHRADDPGLSPD